MEPYIYTSMSSKHTQKGSSLCQPSAMAPTTMCPSGIKLALILEEPCWKIPNVNWYSPRMRRGSETNLTRIASCYYHIIRIDCLVMLIFVAFKKWKCVAKCNQIRRWENTLIILHIVKHIHRYGDILYIIISMLYSYVLSREIKCMSIYCMCSYLRVCHALQFPRQSTSLLLSHTQVIATDTIVGMVNRTDQRKY